MTEGEPVDPGILARLLPQRYPLRLIDRIVAFEDGSRIVARKGVTASEPFFAGHFPARPVMPGVLLCEALAQTSAVLMARSHPSLADGVTLRLRGLERVRFRHPVVPGDVLELEVCVLARDPNRWRFRGRVRVGTAVVAETDFDIAEIAAAASAVHPDGGCRLWCLAR